MNKKGVARVRGSRCSINSRALKPFQSDNASSNLVWVRIPTASSYKFVQGELILVEDGTATVQIVNEDKTRQTQKWFECDEILGAPRLTQLQYINPVNICGSIEERYNHASGKNIGFWYADYFNNQNIPNEGYYSEGYYSELGDVLIAVNPFTDDTASFYSSAWVTYYSEPPAHK